MITEKECVMKRPILVFRTRAHPFITYVSQMHLIAMSRYPLICIRSFFQSTQSQNSSNSSHQAACDKQERIPRAYFRYSSN